MALIDSWMPVYDFSERHEMRIAAAPERVYRAIHASDFGRHLVFKLLLGVRAIPVWMTDFTKAKGFLRGMTPEARMTLDLFFQNGFALLEERRDQELVIGLTGSFWRLTGGIVRTDPDEFRRPLPQGAAKVAWDFVVSKVSDKSSIVTTETRIWRPDESARRRFRMYWTVIRPFSGLLRRVMLKEIRQTAEHKMPELWR